MEEFNDVLFLPLPTFWGHHESLYEIFLPHLVSTTCKLTPFQMQLESVLKSLFLENVFWKYACSQCYLQENTHVEVQFIELTL